MLCRIVLIFTSEGFGRNQTLEVFLENCGGATPKKSGRAG
jgi:hypothetical protein